MKTGSKRITVRIIPVLLTAILLGTAVFGDAVYAANKVTYHETKEEAAAELREGMKSRSAVITVGVKGSTDEEGLKQSIGELIDLAIEHTGDPEEGDYLRFQYDSYKGTAHTTYDGLSPAVEIQYTLEYYDSAEQEAELDEKVNEILESLDLEEKSDYDKILDIHDYICVNTEYDDSQDDAEIRRTAYGALVEGKAVCQGYSLAFYRLLLEAGIDNRILFGTGIESDGSSGPHTWNMVELDGEYYYTDVTWDDSTISRDFFMQPAGSSFEDSHVLDEEYEEESASGQEQLATEEYTGNLQDIRDFLSIPYRFFKGVVTSIKMIASLADAS